MTTTVQDPIEILEGERREAFAALEAAAAPATESTRELTDDEREAFKSAQAKVDGLDERIAMLKASAKRGETAAAAAAADGRSGVEVVGEPDVYSRAAEREHRVSFLRDVMHGQLMNDPGAQDRLRRHMEQHPYVVEGRDVGTGAFAGLTVPQYLTDLVAPVRRAGRPVADISNRHPLPPDGMTVNISRVTTGTAVAAQATENTAVQETDADDTLLTINVRTVAGQQDVSRQAVERSTGADDVVVQDLQNAYAAELDRQLIHADGTSGTHLGILNTVGNIDVAYTDGTPTYAELHPKFADAIQQVLASVFYGVTHIVMHPRRFYWIAKELGSTFPFLRVPGIPQQAGEMGGTAYDDAGRNVLGVPVVLDGNIATNLGAGTNEDVILVVTAPELHLWEDENAPLLIRAEQPGAGSLSVKFVVYGYSAFTAGRYPASQANIAGTGLVTPTF